MKKPICINCPFRNLDSCTLIYLMSDKDSEVTVHVNEMTVSPDCPLVEVKEPHGDLVDRQAAIEVVQNRHMMLSKEKTLLIDDLENLPPAEPEIIYCKDCQHFVRDDIEEYTPYGFYNTYFRAFCDKYWDEEKGEYIDVKIDDFCSYAERRTDG